MPVQTRNHFPRRREALSNEAVANLFQCGLDRLAECPDGACGGCQSDEPAEPGRQGTPRQIDSAGHIDRKPAAPSHLIGHTAFQESHQHRVRGAPWPAGQPTEHDRIRHRWPLGCEPSTGGPAQRQDQQDGGYGDGNVKLQKGLRGPVQGVHRHALMPSLILRQIVMGRGIASEREASIVRKRGRVAKRLWVAGQNGSGGGPKNRSYAANVAA